MDGEALESSENLEGFNTIKEAIIDTLVREKFLTEEQGIEINSNYAVQSCKSSLKLKRNNMQEKCLCGYEYYCPCYEDMTKNVNIKKIAEKTLANNIDGLREALKDEYLFLHYKDTIINYGIEMAKNQSKLMYD